MKNTKFADRMEREGQTLRLIGWWDDLVAYYVAPDGTVWSFNTMASYGGPWSNCGKEDDFRATFKGRYRGVLLPQDSKPVLLVARDADGKEVSRQTVKDEATATQLMVARNRPLMRELTFPKWGIESEVAS